MAELQTPKIRIRMKAFDHKLLDVSAGSLNSAGILRRCDADQLGLCRKALGDPRQVEAIAVLERQLDLPDGHAGTDQAVAARREAGRCKDGLVASAARLEGQKKQPERGTLCGDDLLCTDLARERDLFAQSHQTRRRAVSQREAADRIAAGEIRMNRARAFSSTRFCAPTRVQDTNFKN